MNSSRFKRLKFYAVIWVTGGTLLTLIVNSSQEKYPPRTPPKVRDVELIRPIVIAWMESSIDKNFLHELSKIEDLSVLPSAQWDGVLIRATLSSEGVSLELSILPPELKSSTPIPLPVVVWWELESKTSYLMFSDKSATPASLKTSDLKHQRFVVDRFGKR